MEPEVRHLRAIVALADHGTFTAAAAALTVSQPALTRTVQHLERVVGCDLVARTSRSSSLTAAGAEFVEGARRILGDLDGLTARMRAGSRVRVGFAWLLPHWFGDATRRHELGGGIVDVRRLDDPLAAVLGAEVDVAISRVGVDPDAGLTSRVLATEQRVVALCATSDLVTRPDLHWDDLAAEPVIVNDASGTTRPESWDRVDPDRVVVHCNNFDEWIELTAAGRGISAVPDLICSRVSHPGVVFRRIPGIPATPILAAWRPSGGSLGAVEGFVELLAGAAADAHPAHDATGR
ncbi:LysR family transcriptional regulator [Williamsia deligens]|uniref:LysR family transcriptional regulator n=1 Tax=Williamsia deligens TaxID=321325 RepID=A0ABW3G7Y2_9NOCA|nr:LysR family transcriptional regulator [Williamsia deligens]MCP2192672.1 DNA-binding transcriptional regulator, LysR family [Williamsia deligens]